MTNIALQGRKGVVENPRLRPGFTCATGGWGGGGGGPVEHCVCCLAANVGVRYGHRGLGGRGGADVTYDEVDTAINKLKSGKSPGLNGIPPEAYKAMNKEM